MKTHIPIWCFHGSADKTVPTEFSRIAFKELSAAGGNMKYTECADIGHGVDAYAFTYEGDEKAGEGFVTKQSSNKCDPTPDLWTWLFAQSRKKETANGRE